MGIDFSHGDAHWAYSGFMRFRGLLASSLGYAIPLRDMYDDGSYVCMENEAIWPLINHSDCDGELTVEEMEQILPQLKSILDNWNDDNNEKTRGMDLVESMEEAIIADEKLVFC